MDSTSEADVAQSRDGRARESNVPLLVAGQRVNLLLALLPSALQIDPPLGSRSLLVGFCARENSCTDWENPLTESFTRFQQRQALQTRKECHGQRAPGPGETPVLAKLGTRFVDKKTALAAIRSAHRIEPVE